MLRNLVVLLLVSLLMLSMEVCADLEAIPRPPVRRHERFPVAKTTVLHVEAVFTATPTHFSTVTEWITRTRIPFRTTTLTETSFNAIPTTLTRVNTIVEDGTTTSTRVVWVPFTVRGAVEQTRFVSVDVTLTEIRLTTETTNITAVSH